ncbi:hypothetical protein QEN19_000667 [Hanseniaspora menglaensis]
MQYFGKALGSVTKSWSSINPATLSGAVDVIVVEHADGELSCSPFHVRFGKFQVLKPSQKKVEVFINGQETTIPMKLSDHGEAQFIFEFLGDDLPSSMFASSPVASVSSSPLHTPTTTQTDTANKVSSLEEPDFLDINQPYSETTPLDTRESLNESFTLNKFDAGVISTPSSPHFKPIKEKLEKIKIPTKLDNFTGDLLLDIEGYKSSKDKIHDSDELVQQILREELGESMLNKLIKKDNVGNIRIINSSELTAAAHSLDDKEILQGTAIGVATNGASSGMIGCNRNSSQSNEDFLETTSLYEPGSPSSLNSDSTFNSISTSTVNSNTNQKEVDFQIKSKKYIKTLRLTSDQLKCLNLKHGTNDLKFVVDKGSSQLVAKLYLWKWDTPIVISDIDGTITKSDAMGHVMAMFGKDWTHPGVAKLFTDIHSNGYNIMYLTARSAGLSDNTRAYLKSINQDGFTIPEGPVILSPDRTFTALKREVILKKPEVFKMACLNDIRKLYLRDLSYEDGQSKDDKNILQDCQIGVPMNSTNSSSAAFDDDMPTPFIAGFGNRITDCISYRYVGIPRSRIFTINPYGEVHMELLELSGYKSSYLFINELVDHFFPSVLNLNESNINDERELNALNNDFKQSNKANEALQAKMSLYRNKEVKFSDTNYWREPLPDLSDLSDDSDVEVKDSFKKQNSSEFVNSQKKRTPSFSFSANKAIFEASGSPLQSKQNSGFYGSSPQEVIERAAPVGHRSKSNSVSHRRTKSNESRFFLWGTSSNIESDEDTHPEINDDELLPDALNSTLGSANDIFNNNDGESPKDFGKKLYLELNSPLLSPKASIFEDNYKDLPDSVFGLENICLDIDTDNIKPFNSNKLVFNKNEKSSEIDEFDEDEDEFEI